MGRKRTWKKTPDIPALPFFIEESLALDEDELFFQLGIGLQYEWSPEGVRYSSPYAERGALLWQALVYDLRKMLCDGSSGPKEWVRELIEGEVRNLIVGVATAVAATFEVGFGIAVPVAALVAKKGVGNLCVETAGKKPMVTAKEILRHKKQAMKADFMDDAYAAAIFSEPPKESQKKKQGKIAIVLTMTEPPKVRHRKSKESTKSKKLKNSRKSKKTNKSDTSKRSGKSKKS